jgi:hypothetical protein
MAQWTSLTSSWCARRWARCPEDYVSEWNPLWQESAKEAADAELVRAQTATAYQAIGAIDEGIIAADLYARGVYPGMTKKDVKMAQELAKQPDPGATGHQPQDPGYPSCRRTGETRAKSQGLRAKSRPRRRGRLGVGA